MESERSAKRRRLYYSDETPYGNRVIWELREATIWDRQYHIDPYLRYAWAIYYPRIVRRLHAFLLIRKLTLPSLPTLSARMVLDTGASLHCFADKALFSTYEHLPINNRPRIEGANGTTSDVVGFGDVVLKMTSSGLNLRLKNVMHVPDFHTNLVSGSQLGKEFIKLVFEGGKAELTKDGQFIGDDFLDNGLFVLNATIVSP